MVMGVLAVANSCFSCENCPDDEPPAAASISPSGGVAVYKYSRLLFGYFIEHFDTVVYGGIYDPKSPLSDEDGFRKDVIDALRDAKCSIVRWPGGCFSQAYHWKNGVGPKREPAWDRAWRCEDPNTFGTDEYVKWCRKVGCEPYICTNAGTGTGEEMGEWVEYCNLPEAGWGRRRVANGHREPYDVKYWNIGNENGGGHEIARRSAEEWGPLVRESAKMMRAVDPSLFIVGAGSPITEKWNRSLLESAGRLIDMISVHSYPDKLLQVDNPSPYMKCMMFTDRPENLIANVSRMLDESGCGGGKVGIAIDEWNLRSWHHPGFGKFGRGEAMDVAARRRNDRAATYTMADAIYAASFLNACMRHGDVVKMACFAPVVNARGAIFVHPKGIVKRTTYHVFWMYANLAEPNVVPVELKCGDISDGKKSLPVLDAVLTQSDDGKRRVLMVVNKSPDEAVVLDISALCPGGRSSTGGRASPRAANEVMPALVLSGDSPDAYNDIGSENRVVPHETQLPVSGGKITLPPHSVAAITLSAVAAGTKLDTVRMHAPAAKAYRVGGKATALDATVGFSPEVMESPGPWGEGRRNKAKMSFRVYADGRLVAETNMMTPRDDAVGVHADLKGAETVVIEGVDGGYWLGAPYLKGEWRDLKFSMSVATMSNSPSMDRSASSTAR